MDWDKLRVFHAVAEAGSFTHAGERLTLSQSAVSRQISTLEDSLRVKLFHRHARGLKLTEQGEHLFETAHEVFAKLAMAEAHIADVHAGTLAYRLQAFQDLDRRGAVRVFLLRFL
ncbi:MAG TPA: LysR family transcriptional regulator, partial [Rhodospirillales bacterium]|nr:LysR family transcriptional regulator [Rhodospirillales bacterium]